MVFCRGKAKKNEKRKEKKKNASFNNFNLSKGLFPFFYRPMHTKDNN